MIPDRNRTRGAGPVYAAAVVVLMVAVSSLIVGLVRDVTAPLLVSLFSGVGATVLTTIGVLRAAPSRHRHSPAARSRGGA